MKAGLSLPPPATQVKLIPQDYDPSIMGAINDSLIDTSDAEGRYSFKNVIPGIYNVLAIQIKQRTRMLVTGLEVDSGTITVPPETLQEPGAIRWLLLGSAEHNGYVTIPGTDLAVFVPTGSNDILLDSVPAGTIPEVRYQVLGDTTAIFRYPHGCTRRRLIICTAPSLRKGTNSTFCRFPISPVITLYGNSRYSRILPNGICRIRRLLINSGYSLPA